MFPKPFTKLLSTTKFSLHFWFADIFFSTCLLYCSSAFPDKKLDIASAVINIWFNIYITHYTEGSIWFIPTNDHLKSGVDWKTNERCVMVEARPVYNSFCVASGEDSCTASIFLNVKQVQMGNREMVKWSICCQALESLCFLRMMYCPSGYWIYREFYSPKH